jgi:hypothetical protein
MHEHVVNFDRDLHHPVERTVLVSIMFFHSHPLFPSVQYRQFDIPFEIILPQTHCEKRQSNVHRFISTIVENISYALLIFASHFRNDRGLKGQSRSVYLYSLLTRLLDEF